jgi:hypothetical protein
MIEMGQRDATLSDLVVAVWRVGIRAWKEKWWWK